jgi:hypothetical protein
MCSEWLTEQHVEQHKCSEHHERAEKQTRKPIFRVRRHHHVWEVGSGEQNQQGPHGATHVAKVDEALLAVILEDEGTKEGVEDDVPGGKRRAHGERGSKCEWVVGSSQFVDSMHGQEQHMSM